MVTATTSSTSTAPPSLSCIAASMACVSNGLRFFSPLRSRRPVEGSIRFSTAASGTSLTRTQIFTWFTLLADGGVHATADRSRLTCQSIAVGEPDDARHDLLAELARGRCEAEQVVQPEPVGGQAGDRGLHGVARLGGEPALPGAVALA